MRSPPFIAARRRAGPLPRRGLWLCALAVLIQALLPAVRYPVPPAWAAMAGFGPHVPVPAQHAAHTEHRHEAPPPKPAHAGHVECPVCFTAQAVGLLLAPAGSVLLTRPVAQDDIRIAPPEIVHVRPRPNAHRPRAPPGIALA